MVKKAIVLFLVLAAAFFSAWVLNKTECLVNNCSYDWLAEPEAMFAIVVIPCYSITTLGIAFASAVALRKRFAVWFSAALPAGILAIFLSILIYFPRGTKDSIAGILIMFFWLAIPWFLSNYLGLRLWPNMPE